MLWRIERKITAGFGVVALMRFSLFLFVFLLMQAGSSDPYFGWPWLWLLYS